jgi:hypothetical protein
VVYEQQTGHGRSWQYTAEIVRRWLARVPESVQRLDLEDLEGAERRQLIEQWYEQEQQALQAQPPEPDGEALALLQKQLDELEQQRTVLLNEDPTATD